MPNRWETPENLDKEDKVLLISQLNNNLRGQVEFLDKQVNNFESEVDDLNDFINTLMEDY